VGAGGRWDLRRAIAITDVFPGPDTGRRWRGAIVRDPDTVRLGTRGPPLPDPEPDRVAVGRALDLAVVASTTDPDADAAAHAQGQAHADTAGCDADARPDTVGLLTEAPRTGWHDTRMSCDAPMMSS
jgi:hypothetical protein